MRGRFHFYSLFLLLLWASSTSAATMDTSFTFSTIATEHFNIHYHQGLKKAAEKTAKIAEEVQGTLSDLFKWTPEEKTEVVLIDRSDFPNGFSTSLPYNLIYLFPVPPAIDTTLGEYDDWLRTLFIHEYAHILTLDPARGYSKLTRKIFGKTLPSDNLLTLLAFLMTAPPNSFLPRWWHEGMATWAESEFTGGGRGKSSFYDMVYRMAVAENNLPSIDQINGDVPDWPAGSTPYLFGQRFQRYLAERFGKEMLGEASLKHSGWFPYFLNDPAKRLFDGESYPLLYVKMIINLTEEQEKRMGRLKKAPFTPVTLLANEGEFLTRPRYSPDGTKIAYTQRGPHAHTAIMVMNRDGSNKREIVRRLPSDGGIAWSPNGKKLYFSQAGVYRGYNIYKDLYSFDLEENELERLTKGARIGEPDISPDGEKVAAVVTSRGNQNLAILELKEGDAGTPEIVTAHSLKRVASPRWSPNGEQIAYLLKDNDGASSLRLYDSRTGEDEVLLEGEENIGWPAWRGGDEILFVSDRSGVYNLYVWSIEERRSYPLTHLAGGAFFPDVSPDGNEVVFSKYDSKGMKIGVIPLSPGRAGEIPLPDITNFRSEKPPAEQKEEPPAPAPKKRLEEPEESAAPYSAMNTLAPRFWLPTLLADHKGSVVGAFTAGQDVLGYNTYFIEADYGTTSHESYYKAAYLNNYAYPTFAIKAYSQPLLYTDFPKDYDFYEKEESLSLSARVPLNGLESGFALTVGHEWQRKKALSPLSGGFYKTMPVFEGRRNNLFAGIEFSNSLKYRHSISFEEGRTIELLHRHYSKNVGSDIASREWYLTWSEYFRAPFSKSKSHRTLYLNLKGGISDGDRIGQQAFQLGGISDISAFPLRGYPARFALGKYAATATLEFRAPLLTLMKGWNSKPFFFEKLHGALFVDTGAVWNEGQSFKSNMLKSGAGVELRLDMTLGYYAKVTPTLGFAHGFDPGGESKGYFTINVEL